MARGCSVCSHKSRRAIDKAIVRRQPIRRIAAQYGLGESSLRRHRDTHLPHTVEAGRAVVEEAQAGFQIADWLAKDRATLEAVRARAEQDTTIVKNAETGEEFEVYLANDEMLLNVVKASVKLTETAAKVQGEIPLDQDKGPVKVTLQMAGAGAGEEE